MDQQQEKISSSIRRTLEDLKEKAEVVDSALFNSWYDIPVSPIRDKPFELWSGKHPDYEQDYKARHFLLQENPDPKGPVSIVWRKEYERIQNSIDVAYREGANGVLITGQPGIGKTWFLIWLCRQYLGVKRQFCLYLKDVLWIFSTPEGKLVVHRVYLPLNILDLHGLGDRIPILIDMDSVKSNPPPALTYPSVFSIQASSPDDSRFKMWMKHRIDARTLIMDTWRESELDLAFECHGLTPEYPLKKYIDQFGPVLQTIIGAVKDWGVASTRQERELSLQGPHVESLITTFKNVSENHSTSTSHSVVLVRSIPGPTGKSDRAYYMLLSPYVSGYMNEVRKKMDLKQALDLYRILDPHVKASATAGWVFEGIVHLLLPKSYHTSILFDFKSPVLFISLSDDGTTIRNVTFPRIQTNAIPIHFESLPDLHDIATSLFSELPSNTADSPIRARYLTPIRSNNPLFDAVIITAQHQMPVEVWVLQVSRQEAHSGSVEGLPLLQNIRTAITSSPLFDTKTSKVTFRYVYVTPQAKMSKKSVWHLPSFSSHRDLKGPLHYLPLCWDVMKSDFYSPETIEFTDDDMDVDVNNN